MWLYDLHTPSGGDGLVHLPLIYATHLRVQHEAYAQALLRVASLVDDNCSLRGTLVDGSVFRFDLSGYDAFRTACLRRFTLDAAFAAQLAQRSISVRRTLPALCIAAETEFLAKRRVSNDVLQQVFDLVVLAIGINLANPFVESAVMLARELLGGRKLFEERYRALLGQPTFSHLSFFAAQLAALRAANERRQLTARDVIRFCWVAGFLGGGSPDRSPFESPRYVVSEIGAHDLAASRLLAASGPDLVTPDMLDVPELVLDPSGLTDEWVADSNNLVRLMRLQRVLQVNEEFRHYWQARTMRLFWLLAGSDDAAESFTLGDYQHLDH